MDTMLCDELIQEIFTRISNSSSSLSATVESSSSGATSSSVALVSKRWLHLYRTSKTSLSLFIPPPEDSTIPSLSSLLSHYPFLSSLSLILSTDQTVTSASKNTNFNDHLLLLVSSFCSKLKHLKFSAGPVSLASLFSLSKSCIFLTSLSISVSRPVSVNWVVFFTCLKELSISVYDSTGGIDDGFYRNRGSGLCIDDEFDAELGLEALSLSGIGRDGCGLGWLWRSCKKLKKLKLKSCEGIGDGGSFMSFIRCLQIVEEVELRACRSISDGVLSKLAENSESLNSLLVYDGCSREGLLHFISNCRCSLQKLDFQLPLDLNNGHLSAIAVNFRGLTTLRLQSCCLVTGEGLKSLAIAMSPVLEELALVNCDVVERESGLLVTLGQNLRQLRKLDLSYNEFLLDMELISMLVSCNRLVELKLRGCRGLTSAAILSMFKNCKKLETVDIMHCCGVEADAIELFLINSLKLKSLRVERSKLSDAARNLAANRFIDVTTA